MYLRNLITLVLVVLPCSACWSSTSPKTDLENSIFENACIDGEMFIEGNGINWITICGGQFDMGARDNVACNNDSNLPRHLVDIPDFEIMQSEVTAEAFRSCVTEGACPDDLDTYTFSGQRCAWARTSEERLPMNCIGWEQATIFCAWVDGRLPSESEWEYAARSGGKDYIFPWGDDDPTCELVVMPENVNDCGNAYLKPVCSLPAGNTEQNICDMAGNVNEWVADVFHYSYDGAPADGSAWLTEPHEGFEDFHVVRGGSFFSEQTKSLVTTCRGGHKTARILTGFRCVRSLENRNRAEGSR